MFAISFGNGAFNNPGHENVIILVIDSKQNHSSLNLFIDRAFKFMNSDREFFDNWDEYYKDRILSPASDSDLEFMINKMAEMNHKVSLLHEPIIKAVNIIQPKWNDITLGLETESEYIFYNWNTGA